jgi:hypothetical protein
LAGFCPWPALAGWVVVLGRVHALLRVRVALAWCGGLWLVVWWRVFLRLRLCVCASCAWLAGGGEPGDVMLIKIKIV